MITLVTSPLNELQNVIDFKCVIALIGVVVVDDGLIEYEFNTQLSFNMILTFIVLVSFITHSDMWFQPSNDFFVNENTVFVLL
jgi:hypothetical protein